MGFVIDPRLLPTPRPPKDKVVQLVHYGLNGLIALTASGRMFNSSYTGFNWVEIPLPPCCQDEVGQ